ncbi:hypothetical protein EI42_02763 [Thermosporothrix hazakensis]|jgi:hypothetical protein|uniref:Nucleotidyltransferase-like protein n=2 Tax=Thermosporothrix TaxID=768650 RepID=A0A326UKJ6_THEHA|nr:hypothetical protein [Thermosporothrix hazakensis]PZW29467.1 hypothetical protein EI42_02763 [Thermosporothrix hazakensis]BBH85752.1 hypothetical protein KTC_05030 [Thermosporothrix sp. COM3]GCE45818.1 hypothetical protein KTH_06870 [Thermosporothrix hazakensis]
MQQADNQPLQPEYAQQLLRRQNVLQAEAKAVIQELHLHSLLRSVGTVRQVGSSSLGLLVWRDIDFGVSSPGLSSARAYELMKPLYLNPRMKEIRYFNEGPLVPAHKKPGNRYYYALVYQFGQEKQEWKIDISFWLDEEPRAEPLQDRMERELTPELRGVILWLKEIWHSLPTYRAQVYSVDIYEAVLDHGVRTPAEFDAYLAKREKPTRAASAGMIQSERRYA